MEVLREEGIDAVRYVLWDATGLYRDYSSIRLAYPGQRSEDRFLIGAIWALQPSLDKVTVPDNDSKVVAESVAEVLAGTTRRPPCSSPGCSDSD